MSNKVKDIDIKNWTYYFFNDMIHIKNFDPDNIKLDEKWYKNTLFYYTGYVTTKDLKYIKIYDINPLYHIFNKVNGYFEKINGNKYFMLVPTNKSKKKKKRKIVEKVRDLIRLIIKNSNLIQMTSRVTPK